MGERSKIEWTDNTFNPWVGCTKISPACDHCYAESWAKRAGSPKLWQGERRRTSAANWRKPIKWNNEAASRGVRPRVFCASLADVFDNAVPDQWRADLFALIDATPNLDWLLLTKRIGNAIDMGIGARARQNVWLGATVINQQEAERDIPKLLATPAAVRFLSCEPLLGPIDLAQIAELHGYQAECCDSDACEYCDGSGVRTEVGLHWVIVGGESGHHARPMPAEWCADLAEQCDSARVPFFMKQGSAANWPSYKDFASFPAGLQVREFPRA